MKRVITERYLSWAETWATTLAFAVTQSVEKSERIVADAIAALIATDAEEEMLRLLETRARKFRRDRVAEILQDIPSRAPAASEGALRFANTVYEMASREAFRGFGAEPFFRMPAVARAIVILKVRARFSREQVGKITGVTPEKVEDHLENARLLFSDGRPWVENHAEMSACGGAAARGQDPNALFASYVGNDLDPESGRALHSHLVHCNDCRTGFASFKKNYHEWQQSLPMIETQEELRKHYAKITKMALKIKRRQVSDAPPALPGLRKILRDGQIQAMVAGAAFFMVTQFWMHRHPHFIKVLKHLVLPR